MKQVPKSDAIQQTIARATGDEGLNLDDLAVYEAVFANTKPLRRQGGLYQGARIGADTLAMAAEKLKNGEAVPLALMHRSGLPVGRVVSAELRPGSDGSTQLQGLFYLPRKDSEMVNKIETSVISEVSVNFMPAQLLCSECGFDYMGDDATFDNVFDCTCSNGHKIGKDGAHVRVHGLKQWSELSLVDRGAVNGAKILPRGVTAPDPARLAARGFDDRVLMLRASVSDTNAPEGSPVMTMDVELKANLIVAERDLTAAKATITEHVAKLAELGAKVSELEAKLAASPVADLAAAKAEIASVGEFIEDIGKAALAALGRTETLPEKLVDRLAFVKDLRAKLAFAIPAGGRAALAASTTTTTDPKASFGAFRRG